MKSFVFAVPGDLATPTGGYAYDRRMIAELSALGWRADVITLGEGFPRPSADTRSDALARLAALPPGLPVVIDGLALGGWVDVDDFRQRHARACVPFQHRAQRRGDLAGRQAAGGDLVQ